ncbi:MAG TPA: hypothetical protein VK363_13540 [Pyrinomonadaceae bacterium]|nr:hypothetical protein [Pyrinomonadaceae bacterium]
MRNRALHATRRALAFSLIWSCVVAVAATTEMSHAFAREAGRASAATFDAPSQPQDQEKDKKDKEKKEKQKKPPTVPEPELKAAKAIEAAADVPAMFVAANEFLQKYPKSPLRPQLAPLMADRISRIEDPAQRIAQSEAYLKMFTAPGDAELVNPYLLSAYTSANRLDEAFALAATALDKDPDPVAAMINLARAGLAEARNQNMKYAAQSKQYGLRAIELIEGDRKPAAVSDATWAGYKTQQLPQLYQWIAMISLAGGDKADAKARLTRAIALNPTDPNNYVLISNIANDEYQRLAQEHKAAPAGAGKDEMLKKAEAQMDEVIDAYAHLMALTEGQAQYEAMRVGLKADLEAYYKYRHNGSLDGLQALIDKYKKR